MVKKSQVSLPMRILRSRSSYMRQKAAYNDKADRQKLTSGNRSYSFESSYSYDDRPPPTPPKDPKAVEDPNLVTWDSEDDKRNPKNWGMGKKWAVTAIISAFAFLSPFASSVVSPSLTTIGTEFMITQELQKIIMFSIYTLGFSFGPFLFSPLSEIYGRVYVVQLGNIWYIIWNLMCGFAQNQPQLLVFRILAGIGASVTSGVGGGVLSDVWRPEQRGRGLSIYSLAPALGPSLGPVVGGFIAQNTTWRWGFWAITIANVLLQLFAFVFLRETYAPTILYAKAQKLKKETGNKALHTEFESPDRSTPKILSRAFMRPWKLLLTQPIVQVLAVYNAYNYGIMYLFIGSYDDLWTKKYGQRIDTAGLNFFSLAIGSLIASQAAAPCNDVIYKFLKKRYGYREDEEGVPEFRLPMMVLGTILTPIGLFLFGWSAQNKLHPIFPNLGVGIYMAGSLICYQCSTVYTVDTYSGYAASASAATTFLKSLCAFAFPIFAPALLRALDYGFLGTLLAVISIVVGIPTPWVLWFYGERIRGKSTFCQGEQGKV